MTGGVLTWLTGHAVAAMLSIVVSWADRGAADALRLTASLIGATTAPSLDSTWFSAAYWRVQALSGLLTIPFLFAACVHALVRSDLAMVGRAAFGYLPLAMLGVAIAAPLASLLLSGTDEMCGFASAASGHADTGFLVRAAVAMSTASGVDPFVGLFAALITVAGTLALWLELLIRGAAVEVIVFMLPVFFAAMVWPARRVWATRAIETLVALILSKFAIVAVLTLGGAALAHAAAGPSNLLIGAAIVLLTVFTPWALLRLMPLHEVAAAAAGGLSRPPRDAIRWTRDQAIAESRYRTGAGAGEDDGGAVARLASGIDGMRTGRGAAAAIDPSDFSPIVREGRRATGSGGGASDDRHGGAGGAPAPGVTAPASEDPRGPLPGQFGPGTFTDTPWVLGDDGDERMGPPDEDDPEPGDG